MMDFSILLFDDDYNVMQFVIDQLASIKVAELATDPPWRITLGDYVLNVDCKIITSKAEMERQFAPGNFGKAIASADLILLDNDWQGGAFKRGLEVLSESGWRRGEGPVLAIFTAADSFRPDFIKKALDAGADALIFKNETTHLLNVLLSAVERKKLLSRWTQLGNILVEADPGLVSKSSVMQRFLADAAKVAILKNEPVLILGEIGTGKSRLAAAMHQASPRAKARFKAINPGQVSDSLLQAELFGVARGAFTGALARQGQIELAEGGTVFVDDVESMTPAMQSALLDVIQSKKYVRPGDPQERPIDVRFIFATNADLDELGRRKEFRGDLRSRMEATILCMPNLTDRPEDVADLSAAFVREFYAENYPGIPPANITSDALDLLRQTRFPDNVRGLSNAIRRSLVQLPLGHDLDAAHLLFSRSPGDMVVPISRDDITTLLDVAPRSGPQRAVFERLLEKLPAIVPYRELNEIVGSPGDSVASEALMVAVSRLRDRLRTRQFVIRQDRERKGYALFRVIENA